jgi:hypothetical protein
MVAPDREPSTTARELIPIPVALAIARPLSRRPAVTPVERVRMARRVLGTQNASSIAASFGSALRPAEALSASLVS